MVISYDYYRVFYYVAQYKSFTAAAKVLFSNQPNITRTIKLLESQLGCTLFIRSRYGVTLTKEGEKLYESVSSAMELLQKSEAELSLNHSVEEGMVTLGITETALQGYLLPHLKAYKKTHPKTRIRMVSYTTPEAVKAVEQKLVDFAIVSTPVTIIGAMKETTLKKYQEILTAGKAYQFLTDTPLSLKELSSYPFICLSKNTATYAFYSELFAGHKLQLAPDTEASNTPQLLLMIKEDMGLGFLPSDFAKDAIHRKEIYEIPLKETIPPRSITLIELKEHPLNPAVKAFKASLTN